MSTNSGLLKDYPAPPQPSWRLSPFWLLSIMATLIFLAEMIAMTVIYFVRPPSYLAGTILDGLIMMLLISPALYLLQLKPILKQMEERKGAENALRESEKLLRNVLEMMPVGVWVTDAQGMILHGNPASQELWGGARYVGIDQYGEYKGWWLDSGKRVEAEEWAAARAINRGETSLNEEIEIESFDGARKIILNSAQPIYDEHHSITGTVVVNQDITTLKRAQQALIQTNELMERFFSSISTLIAYMDRDFNFIRVNQAYADSGGHPPEFFPGKNHFDLYPHPENEAIFRRVVETGEPFSILEKPFEYTEFPERGVTYWDWSLQPVKGMDGDVEGAVLSLVDVTERKRAEIQLERQNQELRQLSEAERRQRELAESLTQSVIALNSSLQLEKVLASILEQIRRAIPFQGADIVLVEGNTIRVAGYSGFEGYPDSRQVMRRTYLIEDFPLFSQICSSLRPIVLEDTRSHPAWRVAPGMEWARSYVAAPLVAGDRVIGIINLTSETPAFFDEQTLERLMVLVPPAAAALRNAQLYKNELTARQFAETLSTAAMALAQTLELDQVLSTLIEHINNIIASDINGIGLLDEEERLAVRVANGYPLWTGPDHIFSLPVESKPDTLFKKLITTRKSQLVTDTASEPLLESQPEVKHIRNWLLVPIIAHEKAIGIVGLGKIEPGYFTQVHIQWVEALVSQASVAIQNAWLFEQVRASSERLQALTRNLVDIQEKERIFIARELHDEAGQALSSLKIGLGRLEQIPDCPEIVRGRLQELKQLTDGVMEDLHRLAKDLRPISLDQLGLVAALEQHASSLSNETLNVEFKAMGFDGKRISPAIETALYRIVQEALTNVVRHAHASTVGILLERRVDKLIVFVEDDGVGFESEHLESSSMGLVGMRERAELLGGTLTVESLPGKGTTITVEVPNAVENTHRR